MAIFLPFRDEGLAIGTSIAVQTVGGLAKDLPVLRYLVGIRVLFPFTSLRLKLLSLVCLLFTVVLSIGAMLILTGLVLWLHFYHALVAASPIFQIRNATSDSSRLSDKRDIIPPLPGTAFTDDGGRKAAEVATPVWLWAKIFKMVRWYLFAHSWTPFKVELSPSPRPLATPNPQS